MTRSLVPIGEQVPRRGNAFSRWLGRFLLRLLGWRVQGVIPDCQKMVWIGAPHTSNMDGVLAFVTLTALGIRANTMIKDSAFKGVMAPILRWFGALPIDRRSPKGVVEQSVDAFAATSQMVLLIAPEGTRHNAPELKRGFYHIACGARVPVLPAAVNYARKLITFGPLLVPSSDYAADQQRLMEFYRDHAAPRYAARLSKPLREAIGVTWQPRSGSDNHR